MTPTRNCTDRNRIAASVSRFGEIEGERDIFTSDTRTFRNILGQGIREYKVEKHSNVPGLNMLESNGEGHRRERGFEAACSPLLPVDGHLSLIRYAGPRLWVNSTRSMSSSSADNPDAVFFLRSCCFFDSLTPRTRLVQ